jgi:hypothetical protein
MGHAYDRQYSSQMKQIATKHNVELHEGIYCGLGKRAKSCLNIINNLF